MKAFVTHAEKLIKGGVGQSRQHETPKEKARLKGPRFNR